MDMIRSKCRVVYLLVYIIAGVFQFVFMPLDPKVTAPHLLTVTIYWAITLVILIIHVPRKNHIKIFNIMYMIFFSLLSIMLQRTFENDKLMFFIFMIMSILALMVLRKDFVTFTTVLECISLFIYNGIQYLCGDKVYNYREIAIYMLIIFVMRWLCVTMIGDVSRIFTQKEDQEQSLDDMLQILQMKHRETEAATKSKSQFLSSMSHEIRTPINAVLGMNEMILREAQDEDIIGYSNHIKQSGNMLLSLINDILDFSKIESGHLEKVLVEYDFGSNICDIYNMLLPKAKEKGLKLRVSVDPELPSRMIGDDMRIRQILINLVTNAIKYTEHGNVTLTVTGKVDVDIVHLTYSVKDTGVGIKPEDLGKLTESYTRIEEYKIRNIEGSGLGMSIVSEFLEMMDSELKVESVYGEGSTFSFDIDQIAVKSPALGDINTRLESTIKNEVYHCSFSAPDARLLVVDDNQMNLTVFEALLKNTLCQIDTANSGPAALNLMDTTKYDIVFMDHMMPGMDGVEAMHEARKEGKLNANTPMIVLTANVVSGARKMYKEEGFEGFISKPIDAEVLEKTIKNTLHPSKIQEGKIVFKHPKRRREDKVDFSDLPMVEGMDLNYGYLHLMDKELLVDTIRQFYITLGSNVEQLSGLYQMIMQGNEEALSNFRILVHGMKSSSNIIGCFYLAGMAASLEFAARDGNIQFVKDVAPHFIEVCREYQIKLGAYNKVNDQKITEFEPDTIRGYLDELLGYMDEFDVHGADEKLEQIDQYGYDETVAKRIDMLKAAVVELDPDKAREIIDEIKKYL